MFRKSATVNLIPPSWLIFVQSNLRMNRLSGLVNVKTVPGGHAPRPAFFLTFLFFSLTFLHFKQGAEVVIDDYIDNPAIHRILKKTNTVFFFGMNIIVFFALSRIVLDF